MSDDSAEPMQWVFQYNPEWYDLEASVKRSLVEEWTMFSHRDYARVGQRIYFLRAGGAAGGENGAVVATGRIASLVFEKPDETDEHLRYWVHVVYDAMVVPPLMRPEILQDVILKSYPPLARGIQGTNFHPPADVVTRTEQLVKGRLRPIGASETTVDKHIFVSHSHKDNEFGVRLVQDLRTALGGQEDTVWFDASGGLHGGDAFWRTIVAEIKARPVFIVVTSPDSMASPWVTDEIDLAWRLKNAPGGKLIVPVEYRRCEMRDDLATRQCISFLPPRSYNDALHELLATVGVRMQ